MVFIMSYVIKIKKRMAENIPARINNSKNNLFIPEPAFPGSMHRTHYVFSDPVTDFTFVTLPGVCCVV